MPINDMLAFIVVWQYVKTRKDLGLVVDMEFDLYTYDMICMVDSVVKAKSNDDLEKRIKQRG